MLKKKKVEPKKSAAQYEREIEALKTELSDLRKKYEHLQDRYARR